MLGCWSRAASLISRSKPLGAEDAGELRMEHLERDRPIVPEVLREIDRGHPAPAQLALDPVTISQGSGEPGEVDGQECSSGAMEDRQPEISPPRDREESPERSSPVPTSRPGGLGPRTEC